MAEALSIAPHEAVSLTFPGSDYYFTETPTRHSSTRTRNSSASRSYAGSSVHVVALPEVGARTSSQSLGRTREREEFCPPSTLVSLLLDCRSLSAAEEALTIVVQSGYESDTYVGTNLVQLYSRLNNLPEACRMFNKVEEPNVITWTSVIGAHSKLGQQKEGLQIYHMMQESGIQPDGHAVVSALDACAGMTALEQGKQIHDYIVESGLESNIYVSNALVSMYASCGSLEEASTALARVPTQDVISWSALMGGYVQQGFEQETFELVNIMHQHGVYPNPVTYIHVLEACSSMEAVLEQGMLAHACIVENGFDEDELVGSALIHMYGTSGLLQDALTVFDRLSRHDVVTWTALITGFVQESEGYAHTALCLYECMLLEGIRLNNVVCLAVLRACAILANDHYGKKVHQSIVLSGLDKDRQVSNSLIDMYMKCGRTEDAFHVFNSLSEKTVVTWSALIMGNVELGHGDIAIDLFHRMQQEAVEPDVPSFVCVLKACACVAALGQGMNLHVDLVKRGFDLDNHVCSILICMYSSCGRLGDAVSVFESSQKQTVVIYNALITGYAKNNDFFLASKAFSDMEISECKPDSVTFLSLLIACSNLNLVKEGCDVCKFMRKRGIHLGLDHFNTLVDIFGHAGFLAESEDLLETIPFKANGVGWVSLLSSCRSFKNMILGRRCFDKVVNIEPWNGSGYVLMSRIYSLVGQLESANEIESLRLSLNAWKIPGQSYIEVDNQVHKFVVGGNGHPGVLEIQARLEDVLHQKLATEGPPSQMPELSELGQGNDSCDHSEMLAVGFGLIHTPKGKTLVISKNLCACDDCHSAMMLISKVEKRKVVLIDAFCVHEFKDGKCTCSRHYHRP